MRSLRRPSTRCSCTRENERTTGFGTAAFLNQSKKKKEPWAFIYAPKELETVFRLIVWYWAISANNVTNKPLPTFYCRFTLIKFRKSPARVSIVSYANTWRQHDKD
jgi:hypothetical protein